MAPDITAVKEYLQAILMHVSNMGLKSVWSLPASEVTGSRYRCNLKAILRLLALSI